MSNSRRMIRRNRRSRERFNPQMFLAAAAVDTGGAVVNTTLYTASDPTPQLFQLRGTTLTVTNSTNVSPIWVIIRRVPEGYSAPSWTPSGGTSSVVDEGNVLAFGSVVGTSSQSTLFTIRTRKSNTILLQGDTVILQMVCSSSATGQAVDAMMEYGTRYL